jgi:LL-diaminopimelate aminotransferase
MSFRESERLSSLPPYLFAEIDRIKNALAASGKKIISLGIGDPDRPTPFHIVQKMQQTVTDPGNHRYPSYAGMPSFLAAVANWYQRRFAVTVDPEKEVLALIGSKEGIAHIPLAFVNKGDYVLIPDPGYPVYPVSTLFAGGEQHIMPLLEQNNFLPDLDKIPRKILNKARIMFLNYPNNPTSACATADFFRKVVALASQYGFAVCHDAPYSEIYYDGKSQPSFLQTKGAKEVGMEFHSLSKTYNMTGWRIGFAVGNADLIHGLGKIKENIDSGVFQAVQEAGIAALTGDQTCVEQMRKVYQGRRDLLLKGLDKIGWHYTNPEATFYVWARTPGKMSSAETAMRILNETGIVITPGTGFGSYGEGYLRFALTVEEEVIREVIDKLGTVRF